MKKVYSTPKLVQEIYLLSTAVLENGSGSTTVVDPNGVPGEGNWGAPTRVF